MPNIDKTYPSGIWGKDTASKRYKHVYTSLKFRYDYPDQFDDHFVWDDIKEAVLNNIYISEGVRALGKDAFIFRKDGRMDEIYSAILENGSVDFHNTDIRKHFNNAALKKTHGISLTYEHVVPYDVWGNLLVDLYLKGELTEETFEKIRQKVNVCIITKEEDQKLNKAHLKSVMPEDSDWLNVEGDEFARYKKAGVKIYKKEF